jgi:hypothetical protein
MMAHMAASVMVACGSGSLLEKEVLLFEVAAGLGLHLLASAE